MRFRTVEAPTLGLLEDIFDLPGTAIPLLQVFSMRSLRFRDDSWSRRVCLSIFIHPPKGPCTQIVDNLAPKYLYRDDIKAKVYTI